MRLLELTAGDFIALESELTPMLQEACRVYNTDYAEVKKAVEGGKYGIFVAYEERPRAVCLVEVYANTMGKVANIFLVGGEDLTSWVHLVEDIANKCKARGCSYLEGTGRPGWEKVMARYGFTKIATTIGKRL